jgi:hypothetical protein
MSRRIKKRFLTRLNPLKTSTAKNGARIVVDKRSLWQRKALKGSRLRLLIWGVLAAFLVVEKHGLIPTVLA